MSFQLDPTKALRCTRCGRDLLPNDVAALGEDGDYAYCGPCEERYQESLAKLYPNGQCQGCGTSGREVTNREGKTEVRFYCPDECPNFIDWVEADREIEDWPEFPVPPVMEEFAQAVKEVRARIDAGAAFVINQRMPLDTPPMFQANDDLPF